MGVYCTHDYAHASKTVNLRLPHMLKGLDAGLWAVSNALGLPTIVLPVYLPEDDEDGYSDGDSDTGDSDEPSRWDPASLFNLRCLSRAHLNPTSGFDWIGDQLKPVHREYWFGSIEDRCVARRLRESKSVSKYRGIYWINGPWHSEANLAYITVLSSRFQLKISVWQ